MSNKFFEKVIRSVFVDTRNYRYVARENRGDVYIMRLPIKFLDTTRALDSWELVKVFH